MASPAAASSAAFAFSVDSLLSDSVLALVEKGELNCRNDDGLDCGAANGLAAVATAHRDDDVRAAAAERRLVLLRSI